MPHSAMMAGVVDFILPPEKIPGKLVELTNSIYKFGEEPHTIPERDEAAFKQILSLLRIRKGTDFTYYKQTTIRRRILRRIALNKNKDTGTYLIFLRENKGEQDALYQDLLIPVTSFFRDQKVFDTLCESVFPNIIKNKASGEPVRIWVAGCSTGEEAYSLAMCLKEFLGDKQDKVQIFATDISEPAIAKARAGIYSKSEVECVTTHRLQEFFTKMHGSYQVNKQVRDMCVFAAHNFLKDPPFGKIDFVSCRNVLIYMEPYLQKKSIDYISLCLKPKRIFIIGEIRNQRDCSRPICCLR
jgi:two-component system CheB/CheR fusion protein